MSVTSVKQVTGACAVIMSAVSVLVLAYTITCAINSTQFNIFRIFLGISVVLTCGILTVILRDIHAQNPAATHSFRSLLSQYFIQRTLILMGSRQMSRLLSWASNTRQTQNSVLMTILKKASDTEYGRRYGFKDINSIEEFVERVPLSTYSNYEDYVKRLETEPKARDEKLLTSERVEYFGCSSGTTGKIKLIPITEFFKQIPAKKLYPLIGHNTNVRTTVTLGRALSIVYGFELKSSASGIPIGPISSYTYKLLPYTLSPSEVFAVTDEVTAVHLHAVFGLMEREVGRIDAVLAALIYTFWNHIERHWEELCDIVESGSLTMSFQSGRSLADFVSSEAEQAIYSELHRRRSKTRAHELRVQFSKGFQGIASRIWPKLNSVLCINTGSSAHYGKVLEDVYMKGITQVSTTHSATEGYFGVNLPLNAPGEYTPLIHVGFFEFIPEDHVNDPDPVTQFADQLERGGQYEMVYTSPVGLYRYRTGDIIRIVDFLNQCPVYKFENRVGQALNVYWEKIPETILHESVRQTVDVLIGNVRLVDYTTTESVLTPQLVQPDLPTKFYVFFLELSRGSGSFILTDDEKLLFDKTLRQNYELYDSLRQSGAIGPIRVMQVIRGTFEKLRRSAAVTIQHKQLRVTRKTPDIEFLLSNCLEAEMGLKRT